MATSVAMSFSDPNVQLARMPEATPRGLPGSLIAATTDEQLVAAWLARSNLSETTIRNCRKEATRFLWWCRSRGQCLHDVRYEDLAAYSAFLADPKPAEAWVCAIRWPRTDPRWRPFAGPLSVVSHRQALAYVKGLFNWATAAQYLTSNPAGLMGKLKMPDGAIERYLPVPAIAMMMEAIDRMPTDTPTATLRRARARLLVKLLYLTGARLNEVVTADMRSIRQDDAGRTWFHVVGKGSRKGKMPVSADLLAEFIRYREAFGLAPLPVLDNGPLILTTRGDLARAADSTVFKAVRSVLRGAADVALELGKTAVADRLLLASTHWLRHSAFSHQADAGVPLKTIQNNARHASLATTSRYLHKEDDARHAETLGAISIPRL